MKRKIIFIGNSIVNGFPYSRGKSFPGLIRAAVKDGKAGFQAAVINKGSNGETTAQILARFQRDVLDHVPVCVFIMTGTNDFIYREETVSGCMQNLETMAQQAEQTGIIPVFITPLFVDAPKASRMWMAGLGIDYDEINREVAAFSDAIRSSSRLVLDLNAAYRTEGTDVEGADRDAAPADAPAAASPADAPGRVSLFASDAPDGASPVAEVSSANAPAAGTYTDGVHPTRDGYQFLADYTLAWINEHLEELKLL